MEPFKHSWRYIRLYSEGGCSLRERLEFLRLRSALIDNYMEMFVRRRVRLSVVHLKYMQAVL